MKRRTALKAAAALAAITSLASDSDIAFSPDVGSTFASVTKPPSPSVQQLFLAASKIRCAPLGTYEQLAVTSMAASQIKTIETATLSDSNAFYQDFLKAPEYFADDKSPEAATIALASIQMQLQMFPMHTCDPLNPSGDMLRKARINKDLLELALSSDSLPEEQRHQIQAMYDNLKAGSETRYLASIEKAQKDKIITAQEMFEIMAAERDMTNAVNDVSPIMLEQTALMLDRIGIDYTAAQLKAVSSAIESLATEFSLRLKIMESIQNLQNGQTPQSDNSLGFVLET